MIIFYIDDSGDPNPHHEPLLEGETPLFCLSAVALKSTDWRQYDRSLFGLKRTYFSSEITRYTAGGHGRRPEHYEVKGSDLFQPSHAGDRRRRNFAKRIIELCEEHSARSFAAIWRKDPSNPVDAQSIYTKSLQVLAERFHLYCEQCGDDGIMVADSRTRGLDLQVASSHLFYVFGHGTGRSLTRLVEAPMFADSVLSAGLQIADIIGGCLYGNYYQRRCRDVPGLFDRGRPVSLKMTLTGGRFFTRVPARNYEHCRQYWEQLQTLQFRRTDVAPPLPGALVPGYYGYREMM